MSCIVSNTKPQGIEGSGVFFNKLVERLWTLDRSLGNGCTVVYAVLQTLAIDVS